MWIQRADVDQTRALESANGSRQVLIAGSDWACPFTDVSPRPDEPRGGAPLYRWGTGALSVHSALSAQLSDSALSMHCAHAH